MRQQTTGKNMSKEAEESPLLGAVTKQCVLNIRRLFQLFVVISYTPLVNSITNTNPMSSHQKAGKDMGIEAEKSPLLEAATKQ